MKTWPELPALPNDRVPVIDPRTGLPTRDWYRYMSAADTILRQLRALGLNDLADVDLSGVADGEVLTYEDTDGIWYPV